MNTRTLFEKIWDSHVVCAGPSDSTILYIDLHLLHEVTSPQAFSGLRLASRKVRRPSLTFATLDHNIPTTGNRNLLDDALARTQVETLRKNCREFGVQLFDLDSPDQGIVHVIDSARHDDCLR
jgi:3-isopropylmalate/(R)-2-methylmalate dehydratase large subunit